MSISFGTPCIEIQKRRWWTVGEARAVSERPYASVIDDALIHMRENHAISQCGIVLRVDPVDRRGHSERTSRRCRTEPDTLHEE